MEIIRIEDMKPSDAGKLTTFFNRHGKDVRVFIKLKKALFIQDTKSDDILGSLQFAFDELDSSIMGKKLNFNLIRVIFEKSYPKDKHFPLKMVYNQLDAEKYLYLFMGNEQKQAMVLL